VVYLLQQDSARCLGTVLALGDGICIGNIPKSRVCRSTLGTSTEFGFLYIFNPLSLIDVVTADMVYMRNWVTVQNGIFRV
jgi:hypothetical protein